MNTKQCLAILLAIFAQKNAQAFYFEDVYQNDKEQETAIPLIGYEEDDVAILPIDQTSNDVGLAVEDGIVTTKPLFNNKNGDALPLISEDDIALETTTNLDA